MCGGGFHIRLEGGNGAGEDMSSGSLERFREFNLGPRFAAELLGRRGLQCVSLCALEKIGWTPTPYCLWPRSSISGRIEIWIVKNEKRGLVWGYLFSKVPKRG